MQQLEAVPVADTEASPRKPEAAPAARMAPDASSVEHLSDVRLPMEILLGGARKTIGSLAELAEGSLIVSDRRVGVDVDLYVNGVHLASGELVNTDNTLGLRIKRFAWER